MKTFKQIKSLKVYERKILLTRKNKPAGIAEIMPAFFKKWPGKPSISFRVALEKALLEQSLRKRKPISGLL